MKTAQEWLSEIRWLGLEKLKASDIEQIQREAVELYKSQHYNPANVARADRIKKAMMAGHSVIG